MCERTLVNDSDLAVAEKQSEGARTDGSAAAYTQTRTHTLTHTLTPTHLNKAGRMYCIT